MDTYKYDTSVLHLVDRLMAAKRAYYAGQPIISNAEFDALEEQLRSLDPHNKYFDIVQSRSAKDKIYHSHPMLSMKKALSLDKLKSWMDGKFPKAIAGSSKLDGMSIELSIRNGLFSASTRGDGEFGEDCTQQVKHINPYMEECLLHIAAGKNLVLRGEAILSKTAFRNLNNVLIEEGKEKLSNPRNGVVGLFNNETKGHLYLYFVTIVIFEVLEPVITTYTDALTWLKEKMGVRYINLSVIPFQLFHEWKDIVDACEESQASRKNGECGIDGLVFRINDTNEFFREGHASHHWRAAIAYKFPAQQGTVTIKYIEWSVGTKDVTPIANFEPVDLGGAMISRANLHSLKNMVEIGACIGAVMVLSRQGDVIPMLHKTAGGTRFEDGQPVERKNVVNEMPFECPACNRALILSKDLAHLTCRNPNCKGKLKRKIEIFAKALGIDFIGSSGAAKIAKLIDQPEDLLLMSQIEWNVTIGSKVIAYKIKDQIDDLKNTEISLADFIGGLSLGFGSKTVTQLFDAFGVAACCTEIPNFKSLKGVGNKQAHIYERGFAAAGTPIYRIRNAGFNLTYREKTNNTAPVVFFCVTGALSKSRKDIIVELESKGWKFKSGVSSALQYLICNDTSKTSNKIKKARDLGIQIISEEEVTTLLN